MLCLLLGTFVFSSEQTLFTLKVLTYMSPPLEELPRPPLNRLDCFYPHHFMTVTKSVPRSRALLFGEKDIAVIVFTPGQMKAFHQNKQNGQCYHFTQ